MKNKSIISLILIFIVSLGLVVGVSLLTSNAANRNKSAIYENEIQSIFGASATAESLDIAGPLTLKSFFLGESTPIKDAFVIKDSNAEVGKFYIAEDTNGFGSIKLAVGVKDDAIFKVIVLNMDQSMGAKESTEKLEQNIFLDEEYAGTTVSKNTIDGLLQAVADHAQIEYNKGTPVEKLKYEDFFGKGYTETPFEYTSSQPVLTNVTKIHVEDKDLGYAFYLTDSGDYLGYEGVENGEITIHALTDMTGSLLGVYIPKEDYGHTWSYSEKILEVVDKLVGDDIRSLTDLDGNTGATSESPGSATLGYNMLVKLSEEVQSFDFLLKYSEWFDGDYEIISLNDEITENIIKAEEIREDGIKIGNVYHLKGSSNYDKPYGDSVGSIVAVVAIDKDGVIVGVDLPENTYEQTKSYYEQTLEYFQQYIGQNLYADHSLDDVAGATNSPELVKELMDLLKAGGQK